MPLLTRKTPLEPVAPGLIAVVLVHVLLGMTVWMILPLWKVKAPVKGEAPPPVQDRRYWFSPEDFKRLQPVVPETPVKTVNTPLIKPEAEPAVSLKVEPAVRPTNKIITLSPVVEVDPQAVPSGDMAKKDVVGAGVDMDPVLNALEDGLKREWNAPPVQQVPALNRQARLKLSIGHEGDFLDSQMVSSSGSALLDESVKEAVLKLKKISQALPSSFPKDRYTVEVNFHIE